MFIYFFHISTLLLSQAGLLTDGQISHLVKMTRDFTLLFYKVNSNCYKIHLGINSAFKKCSVFAEQKEWIGSLQALQSVQKI